MKRILRKLTILAFVLTAAVSTFANSIGGNNETNIDLNAFLTRAENPANNFVPQAVLDANFREWQPAERVPLIPAPINDIMMTDGRVIYYNPLIVNQVPPKIRAFFLAHEYGHIMGRTSNEFLSDQFAARVYAQTDKGVVKAAVWHFYNIQGNMCDASHGCGWQRALNIGKTAGFSQDEIENIIRGQF